MGGYFYHNNKTILGRGGFGEVVKSKVDIDCAVKKFYKNEIIQKFQKSWEESKNIIKQEIKNLRRCQSINVVQIYNYTIDDNCIEITMELCDKTLLEYSKEKGKLSLDEIKNFFLQLNNALKFMHQNNIVHRDLKLENIFIKVEDNENIIKLGDFGLSKYANENDEISTFCGTKNYMAPEIESGHYTSNVDIWSIGVMMYCLHYGEYPTFKNRYKLIQSELFSEEDTIFLNLLNKIFEEPNKRITWEEYFSDEFFKKEGEKSISSKRNLYNKKVIKIITDCEDEITCLQILNNFDLCASLKDKIIIFDSNNYNLKQKIILNNNFKINHLLLIKDNLIGVSSDDGNFYIINLFNDNFAHSIFQILQGNKKKISMAIKLQENFETLVLACDSSLVFWKNNQNNKSNYIKHKNIDYKGKMTSLIEYPKKYLIGALAWDESIKIFSLTEYKEIKSFNDIFCSSYPICLNFLDDKTLVIVGESFYIFDLEKLEFIKKIEYQNFIDSIIKFGNSYLIGISSCEDIFQLQQIVYNSDLKIFQTIASLNIHQGNIGCILQIDDIIITGACDKTIKILK